MSFLPNYQCFITGKDIEHISSSQFEIAHSILAFKDTSFVRCEKNQTNCEQLRAPINGMKAQVTLWNVQIICFISYQNRAFMPFIGEHNCSQLV